MDQYPYYDTFGWGPRGDGTHKGPGFASVTTPNGQTMTEWAMSGQLGTDREQRYPTFYEGIFPWELEALVNEVAPKQYGYTRRSDGEYRSADPLIPDVLSNAYNTALYRVMMGLSPFWTPGEPTQTEVPYHLLERR